ncbi:hypothetical protein EVAR_66446_1 [Eumeta japonica]|uniref:Uncharacterized protein n=1 Tax=Eumeta variegata TaxID=151549 RepID=A0A4C2A4Z8_EUMVA|nr:hypothetical protein EVAR_66446_1 [Eumeta japonica]
MLDVYLSSPSRAGAAPHGRRRRRRETNYIEYEALAPRPALIALIETRILISKLFVLMPAPPRAPSPGRVAAFAPEVTRWREIVAVGNRRRPVPAYVNTNRTALVEQCERGEAGGARTGGVAPSVFSDGVFINRSRFMNMYSAAVLRGCTPLCGLLCAYALAMPFRVRDRLRRNPKSDNYLKLCKINSRRGTAAGNIDLSTEAARCGKLTRPSSRRRHRGVSRYIVIPHIAHLSGGVSAEADIGADGITRLGTSGSLSGGRGRRPAAGDGRGCG